MQGCSYVLMKPITCTEDKLFNHIRILSCIEMFATYHQYQESGCRPDCGASVNLVSFSMVLCVKCHSIAEWKKQVGLPQSFSGSMTAHKSCKPIFIQKISSKEECGVMLLPSTHTEIAFYVSLVCH